MKYEYKSIYQRNFWSPEDLIKELNALGLEGWELVTITTNAGMPMAWLKRKV